MAKTFLSGLVLIVKHLCQYTTKYGAVILPILDAPEKDILQALISACNAFMLSSIVTQAKDD